MFNVINFLEENQIDYITGGAEVAKGNININCPFCDEDHKFHMGINLKKHYFGCWRSTKHRGRDISYLVAKLLKCSIKYAKYLVYGEDNRTLDKQIGFLKAVRTKLYPNTTFENESRTQVDLSEFYTLFKPIYLNSVYYKYLKRRGFDNVSLLIDKYNLKFSPLGNWSGRIIFPIYIDEQLVTWQGRDITNQAKIRYRDLEKGKSVVYTKSCVYNYDRLEGNILYITEGVFDVLKLDFYTPSEVAATCVFTKTVTQDQYKLLHNKIKDFKQIRILFDKETLNDAHKVKAELLPFHKNIKIVSVPKGVKDAGDMSARQIKEMIYE